MSKEELIREITQECSDHNDYIGAGERPQAMLRRDAEHIYHHRVEGVTVETMAMMITDLEFALKKLRK